jgi:four helix bundle protein
MSNYQTLLAWQKAMDLADSIYDVVNHFSTPATFALSDQMRRSALSVPSNIAEGNGRWSAIEYRHFVRQARGSTLELETQIIFARRRHLIADGVEAELLQRTAEVARLLNGLLRYLGNRAKKPPAIRDPRSAIRS